MKKVALLPASEQLENPPSGERDSVLEARPARRRDLEALVPVLEVDRQRVQHPPALGAILPHRRHTSLMRG
jgi:hypothetical protein